MGAEIKISGLDKFEKNLLKCCTQYPKVTEKFLREEGNEVKKRMKKVAKKKVGKKTGNYLKGFDKEKPVTKGKVCEIKVYNSAPHSHLIEYGTVKRSTKKGANRGYMKGAFILDEVKRDYSDEFSKNVATKLVDELLKNGGF